MLEQKKSISLALHVSWFDALFQQAVVAQALRVLATLTGALSVIAHAQVASALDVVAVLRRDTIGRLLARTILHSHHFLALEVAALLGGTVAVEHARVALLVAHLA